MATTAPTTTYHLIVDSRPAPRFAVLRTTDDYDTIEEAVRAGADYQAGELRGEVVGAYCLTFTGRFLLSSSPVAGFGRLVAEELRARPDWIRDQRASASEDHRRAAAA